jgi:hypothetical protein
MNTQPLNQHTPHLVLNNKHNVDCLCQNPKLKTKMQNNQLNVKLHWTNYGLELSIRVFCVKKVLHVYIFTSETNPYFVLCSSLELELVCEKDANNGIN